MISATKIKDYAISKGWLVDSFNRDGKPWYRFEKVGNNFQACVDVCDPRYQIILLWVVSQFASDESRCIDEIRADVDTIWSQPTHCDKPFCFECLV